MQVISSSDRYLHVLEEETGKDPLLVDVFESEMSYCLKSVPTLSADDFSFHNQVQHHLLSLVQTPGTTNFQFSRILIFS